MATSKPTTVLMRPLKLDFKSISAAAKTLSLSFACDPLIRWLNRNPNGPGWETLLPTLQQWQQARIREYSIRGIGMEAVTAGENPANVGVCFLFPPRSQHRWLNPLWWPTYLRVLWDEYWVRPSEPFANEKRIGIMMDTHYEFAQKIKSRYPPNSLYYLEIAAVRPDTQGMGVGGTIMKWVVRRIGSSPCFLECTNEKNVGFYEKYGFKVVDQKELSDEADPSQCWTCKRRHKKCDETRPVCKRCVQARIDCEGYETRLTWGPSDTTTPRTGAVLNPVRQTRSQRKLRRSRAAEIPAEGDSDYMPEISDLFQVPSPDQLDLLVQYGSDGQVGAESLPSDDVSGQLMENFATKGYQTLTGRAGTDTLFKSDILPLSNSCVPLRQVCLAYQASLDMETVQWTPIYMQLALSHYFNDLNTPEKLDLDATLATGVLLCSVSINSLYIWTPLLKGLHGVLQHRGLLSTTPHTPLGDHLVEVIALLDIPCFTLNRISRSLDLWKVHVGPKKKFGIEQTSGLPYTLISLLADLGSPEAEERLLQWTGELGDEFIQIHLWEAFRFAGILHSRALACNNSSSLAQDSPAGKARLEVLRMKVFASIQAIIDSGAFTFRQPLASAIFYPLFIAALFAEGEQERKVTRLAFRHLMDDGQERMEQVTLDIVTRVWEKGKGQGEGEKLALATEVAAELNIELHLY
ncbi:hypothetical protein ACJZ2D_004855 [Fusarium nematophilum]